MNPETRQQIIALILGVIFIVGFILFAQRLGQFLRSRQQGSKVQNVQITPTPTPMQGFKVATDRSTNEPTYDKPGVISGGKSPTTVPQTGPETILLPSLVTLLGAGMYLRSKKIL